VRQYFPKGIDLRRFGDDDLAVVEQRLNHRPRKTLEWRTRIKSSPRRWHPDRCSVFRGS
jgi:IS30 family transposase